MQRRLILKLLIKDGSCDQIFVSRSDGCSIPSSNKNKMALVAQLQAVGVSYLSLTIQNVACVCKGMMCMERRSFNGNKKCRESQPRAPLKTPYLSECFSYDHRKTVFPH